MTEWILQHGDCRELMAAMPEASVDSIVTDPPYDLTAGKKGGSGPASVNLDSPAGRARITAGFMGMSWDATGVAFDPETWRIAMRVLKPGGHLLAFGGSRTYHRLACAVEDAGFEIRDQIMWIYGSGFPKGGNRDGIGTCLKPSHEPIVMARKPCVGSARANIAALGTGGLNIDACRVPTDDNPNGGAYAEVGGRTVSQSLHGGTGMNVAGKTAEGDFVQPVGRWPANVIHDGSDEVIDAFPQAPGQQRPSRDDQRSQGHVYGAISHDGGRVYEPRDQGGSAARFFYCAKASKADRDEGLDQFAPQQFVQFQTGGGESGEASSLSADRDTQYRNIHPTVKPEGLMRYIVRLATPVGGIVLDPFTGSGSTGKAAMLEGYAFVGCELTADYVPIAEARIAAGLARLRAGDAATAPRVVPAASPSPSLPQQARLL